MTNEKELTPHDMQEIDLFQVQVVAKLKDILESNASTRDTMRILTETLAAHIRQNIDTIQKINESISEQMSYRLFRQNLEENNLQLELAKKSLELDFAEKRYNALAHTHEEDTEETDRLRYEHQKQQIELDSLKKNLEILQNSKSSTQNKIKASSSSPSSQKIKEVILFTGVGTLTAAAVTGLIAFVLWLARLYITSNGG
jgi:hypothetical protein